MIFTVGFQNRICIICDDVMMMSGANHGVSMKCIKVVE